MENGQSTIQNPDGSNIEKKTDIIYLGGLISCHGKATRVVSRGLGEGRGVFKSLDKLWSNSNLNWHRKVAILNACVTSKVMWSLESCWLLQADSQSVRNLALPQRFGRELKFT